MTSGARTDVGLDINGELGPIERTGDSLHSLAHSKMAVDDGVMMLTEKTLFKRRRVEHVELAGLRRRGVVE